MELEPVSFCAVLEEYRQQAAALLAGLRSGDAAAVRVFHENLPAGAGAELSDAQLALARWYGFQSWAALAEYVEAVTRAGSPVFQFESAVEAVIGGDLASLEGLLREHPELIAARSTRVTSGDPPVHRATLLHYVAANGVEGCRQRPPRNAVEIATTLLTAGAEVDALADMYGGHYTTMSMLVSSTPPAAAGVQVALVETLLDFGAVVEAQGSAQWGSPLMTALAFGFRDAAEALARRGARVESVATAAGLGRLADAVRLLPAADGESRHRALALAAQHGHLEIVRLLLDAGEEPSRYNPDGNHSHSTPLHQAALAGHKAVVRLLVERGARLDIRDMVYQGTPLGWAMYAGQNEIAEYLRAAE